LRPLSSLVSFIHLILLVHLLWPFFLRDGVAEEVGGNTT
jgi:hypothetical protein